MQVLILSTSLLADKRSPLDEGCKVIIQKAWPLSIVGNVFE